MERVYFIGIGGIGMSAIARYFAFRGLEVAGYDLVRTPLTDALTEQGIKIHFEDDPTLIPETFRDKYETLVVYTPAVPQSHRELCFFREHGYKVLKRAQILGRITRMGQALCVAGTHGKTTTSTMLAHLLRSSEPDCNAFLGGISVNYGSNYLLSGSSDLIVVEADEYDRSFHQLSPHIAVVTSTDPDHLDIYGTNAAYVDSFRHFVSLIEEGGCLVMKKGLSIGDAIRSGVKLFTYSAEEPADYYASNTLFEDGHLYFDWHGPNGEELKRLDLGVPLRINVENAVAALAVAHLSGSSLGRLRAGIASFRGVQRRFERVVDTDRVVLISDYAHHPSELKASLSSVRELYKGKRILGIFQPHLYSRTADFYQEFAENLSLLDEIILVDIYPAREEPMKGVSSQMIADLLPGDVPVVAKNALLPLLKTRQVPDVVIVLGAGDIDHELPYLAEYLRSL